MRSGTVVVLPTDDSRCASVGWRLTEQGFLVRVLAVPDVPSATLAARVCGVLAGDPPVPPLFILAFGESATLLPAVALAQRAAHRRVHEYVLIDPVVPAVSDGWPDAPVTVFTDGDQRTPSLRGWRVGPAVALDAWEPNET